MQTDFTVQFYLNSEAVMLKVGESSVRRQILPRDSGVAPLVAISDQREWAISNGALAPIGWRPLPPV